MKNNIHHLKQIRNHADVMQQDVAFLLNIDSGNLARYESEKRLPFPEMLLLYHFLFGVPISKILEPLHSKVKNTLIRRSKLLLSQSNTKITPKSKHSIAYIQTIVNNIINNKTYDV